jgi:hypothetical protein
MGGEGVTGIGWWRRRHREKSTVERAPPGEELGGEGAARRDRG